MKKEEKNIKKIKNLNVKKQDKIDLEKDLKIDEKKDETIDPELEKINKAQEKRQNRQIMWFLIIIAVIMIGVLLVPTVYNQFANKFEYKGMKFQKTKLGEIPYFSTSIPIMDTSITNGVITKESITNDYNLNLRNDPRVIENINTNLTPKDLKFIKVNPMYISIDPDMRKCSDTLLGLLDLSGFLRQFAGLDVRSATLNNNYTSPKVPYVDCNTKNFTSVIIVQSGDETKIEKPSKNCYVLTFKDCEVTQVSDRFITLILEGYMDDYNNQDKITNDNLINQSVTKTNSSI